ncbi:hypothetical protein ERJ75_000400100 [Trypanosoma vivax]|nr:hypothetical protein ERJ75_000400100 [Trypanosoma vivax]
MGRRWPAGLPRDNGWARRLVGKGTSAPTGNANAAAESSLGNSDSGERTAVGPHGSQRSRGDSFSSVQGSKRQRDATTASHDMRKYKGTGPMQRHKAEADGTRRAGLTQARRTGREEEVCLAMLRDTEGQEDDAVEPAKISAPRQRRHTQW